MVYRRGPFQAAQKAAAAGSIQLQGTRPAAGQAIALPFQFCCAALAGATFAVACVIVWAVNGA